MDGSFNASVLRDWRLEFLAGRIPADCDFDDLARLVELCEESSEEDAAEIKELKERVEELETEVDDAKQRVEELEEQIEMLEGV